MNRLARVSLPLLRSGAAALSGAGLRSAPAAGGLSQTLPPVLIRGQHTLRSAPIPSSRQSVRHARPLDKERMVQVDWEDGGRSLYPFTWLRDNCQCPVCTLQSAQARKLLMSEVDVNTGVDSVDVTADNKVSSSLPSLYRYYSLEYQLIPILT